MMATIFELNGIDPFNNMDQYIIKYEGNSFMYVVVLDYRILNTV